jgi:hypothetical protein
MSNELTLEQKLELIQRELEDIKARNERVEADKAWEVSRFRVGSICVITYVIAASVMGVIGNDRIWLNAIVPVMGFLLSAQSLPLLKQWWLKRWRAR